MDTREELLRDEFLTRIKENLNSYTVPDLLHNCIYPDPTEWETDFDETTSKTEYDRLKWELVTFIAENDLYHDFLGE